ncbi:hypothetical protein IMCC14465_08430 [alpha proteobacterium IMCC14465]|uniref:Uncharacterized protein n=1 Tax=alpha proteobacterium IMCC14465 TaxID=1220535 RepID=J9DVN4_9PROT|nr:hypothetical protein IMCC14465_08430 [alpha proteobacterium IMCC14465]
MLAISGHLFQIGLIAFLMKHFLWISICVVLLAACASDAYYADTSKSGGFAAPIYDKNPDVSPAVKASSDSAQSSAPTSLHPATPNIQLARLGEPSLVWREGETTILQFAGMPDDKKVPDCTLLVFLDARGQPTGLHSRNPAASGVNIADDTADNAACFKAWSKFKRRQYRG